MHIPGRENVAGDFRTDPKAFFRSLSAAEQDRVFTKAGAESIRLGADVGKVVNARRGAAGLAPAGARLTPAEVRAARGGRSVGRLETRDVFGRQLYTTTEGTRGRNRPARAPRLMPESILQIAGRDRDEAVRLLRRNGYLSDARPAALKAPARRPKVQTSAPAARPAKAAVKVPAQVSAATSLRRGIDSGIRESKPLSGGAVGEVHLVTFNDGSQAIRKRASKAMFGYSPTRLTDNEVLASKVGEALRAPVPAVVRTADTEVFMQYVPDARPGMWLFRGLSRGEQPAKVAEFMQASGDAGRRLGLLDLLIANDDRHNENWLVRPDGSIVGIDHGLVWPVSRITAREIEHGIPHFTSPFAGLFVPRRLPDAPNQGYVVNDLTRADIDWVQQRLEALRPDFAALGHAGFLDYSLARLRQLRPWARGTTNRIRP